MHAVPQVLEHGSALPHSPPNPGNVIKVCREDRFTEWGSNNMVLRLATRGLGCIGWRAYTGVNMLEQLPPPPLELCSSFAHYHLTHLIPKDLKTPLAVGEYL